MSQLFLKQFKFTDKTECVDKGDLNDCFLGAQVGQCQQNPSYYLRFCADSCREFIQVCKDEIISNNGKCYTT